MSSEAQRMVCLKMWDAIIFSLLLLSLFFLFFFRFSYELKGAHLRSPFYFACDAIEIRLAFLSFQYDTKVARLYARRLLFQMEVKGHLRLIDDLELRVFVEKCADEVDGILL